MNYSLCPNCFIRRFSFASGYCWNCGYQGTPGVLLFGLAVATLFSALVLLSEGFLVAGLVSAVYLSISLVLQGRHVEANTPVSNGDAAVTLTLFGVTVIAILLLNFLPAWVAIKRGNLNAQAVVWIDVLTGWTGVGWLLALALAIGGRKRPQPTPPRQAGPPAIVSPDGRWWWDGRQWLPMPPTRTR